jgi:drug/metabolite transporter (DMT)-like permease
MVAAMALFVCNDALVKLASGYFPIGQLMAVRGLFASLCALAMVLAFKDAARLPLLFKPIVILRGCLEGLVAFLFISALKHLPLANITSILMSASLIVIVLAVVLGIEQVGWRRWAAVFVGFLGVLIVVRPSTSGFNWFSVLALMSAALVAVRELVTKKIGSDIPSSVVALATTLATGTVGALIGYGDIWKPLILSETIYLVAAAILVAFGNLAIIIAYRGTDVSVVSGYRYSIVIMALIMGYLVWGDIPDMWSLIGSVLIVGSGLYTLHRQRVRQRQAMQNTPVP